MHDNCRKIMRYMIRHLEADGRSCYIDLPEVAADDEVSLDGLAVKSALQRLRRTRDLELVQKGHAGIGNQYRPSIYRFTDDPLKILRRFRYYPAEIKPEFAKRTPKRDFTRTEVRGA